MIYCDVIWYDIVKHTIAYKYIDNMRKTLQYCIHDSWKSIDCTMGLLINAQCQLTSVEGMIYITSIHSFTILSYLSSITHTHTSHILWWTLLIIQHAIQLSIADNSQLLPQGSEYEELSFWWNRANPPSPMKHPGEIQVSLPKEVEGNHGNTRSENGWN